MKENYNIERKFEKGEQRFELKHSDICIYYKN